MRPARVMVGPGRGHAVETDDPLAWLAITAGRYEREVVAFLAKHLREAKVFYDVGAHTGYYTRVAVKLMPPGGQVFAFEPHPALAEKIRASFPDVTVRQEALGNENGETGLTDQSIPQLAAGVGIPIRRLDSLGLPTPDVVKIDVEGAEVAVLAGMDLSARPALAVECHSMSLLHHALKLLEREGYETVRVTRGGDGIGPPTVLAA